MQIEVKQCNAEVAMETQESDKFVHRMKKKVAGSRFALSNQNIVEQLEKMRKTKTRLKLSRPS